MEKKDLKVGKIYKADFGNNVEIIFRYKEQTVTNIVFFDHVHYWNGFETFNKDGYCVSSAITELRKANKAEKHTLLRFSIEHDTI